MRYGRCRVVKPARMVLSAVLLCGGIVGAIACAPVAPVVQGQVVSADAGSKTITVQDETKPGGPPLTYDVSKAEMGVPPVPGDLVRMAYRVNGDKNTALRVMNLTHEKSRGN